MTLSRHEAQRFYDHFGSRQDTQAFYEDAALDDLVAHAQFDQAENVFEFGCGTGRFAQQLLRDNLSLSATYTGIDISPVMISLAAERLKRFGSRVTLACSDGEVKFDMPDHSIDRLISTYVLDLLPESDIRAFSREAHRVLTPNGKLCLVSLAWGNSLVSRTVTTLWRTLYTLKPKLVGGCRPLHLHDWFEEASWRVEHNHTTVRFGIPSEVIVAGPVIHGG